MSEKREVVVLSGVRTAIGKYGGRLKDLPLTDLAAAVVREAVRRANIDPPAVEHVVIGNVIDTDAHDMYLARVAAIKGGLPVETPAFSVNRLCASGLQAIISAAQLIELGEVETALAGGAESMSRAPYWVPALRWGQRMNDGVVVDAAVAALTDPFADYHMGITAENVAERWGLTREEQDELSVESHRRAARAIEMGYFKEQILPIEVRVKGGAAIFDQDEHVRADASLSTMARLAPVFRPGGTVTAGNAAGMNDAAAALVLMERSAAVRRGLRPLGRLIAHAYAGVEPQYMGIGPVPAVRRVLERARLAIDDLDVVEMNEAFAATALATIRELGLPTERTNPHGSGISLGHPIGATGAILAVKALYALQRSGGRYALVTMCVGGGQGLAAIFERL